MSQPRCRPDDLAIVVESYNPENLGRIVKVIRPHVPSTHLYMHDPEPIWDIESDQLMIWSVGEKTIWERLGPCPDKQLQPLRGRGSRVVEKDECLESVRMLDTHPDAGQRECTRR